MVIAGGKLAIADYELCLISQSHRFEICKSFVLRPRVPMDAEIVHS
jgi:hypothetical protein